MEKPAPPPEAALIRLAREAAHIKTPEAAKAAQVSTARWSHIENGYETRKGSYKPVTGRAVTIAHMAHAVGLGSSRLRGAGRADAADILDEILRRGAEADGELPQIVADNWHIQDVRDLWNLDKSELVRLGMIGLYLSDESGEEPASNLFRRHPAGPARPGEGGA